MVTKFEFSKILPFFGKKYNLNFNYLDTYTTGQILWYMRNRKSIGSQKRGANFLNNPNYSFLGQLNAMK